MKKLLTAGVVVLAFLFVIGCTNPISVGDGLTRSAVGTQVDKSVGFHCNVPSGNGAVTVPGYIKGSVLPLVKVFEEGKNHVWLLASEDYVCPKCGGNEWVHFSNNSGVPNGNNVQLNHPVGVTYRPGVDPDPCPCCGTEKKDCPFYDESCPDLRDCCFTCKNHGDCVCPEKTFGEITIGADLFETWLAETHVLNKVVSSKNGFGSTLPGTDFTWINNHPWIPAVEGRYQLVQPNVHNTPLGIQFDLINVDGIWYLEFDEFDSAGNPFDGAKGGAVGFDDPHSIVDFRGTTNENAVGRRLIVRNYVSSGNQGNQPGYAGSEGWIQIQVQIGYLAGYSCVATKSEGVQAFTGSAGVEIFFAPSFAGDVVKKTEFGTFSLEIGEYEVAVYVDGMFMFSTFVAIDERYPIDLTVGPYNLRTLPCVVTCNYNDIRFPHWTQCVGCTH